MEFLGQLIEGPFDFRQIRFAAYLQDLVIVFGGIILYFGLCKIADKIGFGQAQRSDSRYFNSGFDH